jgi:N-acetylmuramic acid 6-phosphate etherase
MRKHKIPVTEQHNPALDSLDTKSLPQLLRLISREDRQVPLAVAKVVPDIAAAIDLIVPALAAECIPTFGTDQVVGVLAGGPEAMFRPVEGAEDDPGLAIRDLQRIKLDSQDVLVGISASGRTPYTLAGLKHARRIGAATVALTANPDAPMNRSAQIAIVPVVGPEVVAGSTRMKAGTAQKLVLNMLSTASMIRLGRVFSNWMINVQLTNSKLRRRARGILTEATGASAAKAARALAASGGHLPVALLMLWKHVSRQQAQQMLSDGTSIAAVLRQAQIKS